MRAYVGGPWTFVQRLAQTAETLFRNGSVCSENDFGAEEFQDELIAEILYVRGDGPVVYPAGEIEAACILSGTYDFLTDNGVAGDRYILRCGDILYEYIVGPGTRRSPSEIESTEIPIDTTPLERPFREAPQQSTVL